MDQDSKELLGLIQAQQHTLLQNQKEIFERLQDIETAVGIERRKKPVSMPQTSETKPVMRGTAPEQKPVKQEQPSIKPEQPPIKPEHTTLKPGADEDVIFTGSRIIGRKPDQAKASLEFQIGGTWLNRLGAVAVILGLAFFLKYSFDNQWIGPTGRIILGIVAGLALLAVGEKLRSKYFVYSQGLVGAGSLALYFSVYAAYDFYQLITPAMAFVFLIIVMANTVLTSVRHNSYTVGVLGILGGYAAPLLISTGNPLPLVYFGYLAILTCGILGVSIYKRWNSFRIISFVINQAMVSLWYFSVYEPKHLVPTLVFVTFNFIAYLVIATGYNIKVKTLVNDAETILIAINALAFFAWSKLLLEDTFIDKYMGFYTLAVALAYIFIGRLAFRLHSEDRKQVYTLFGVAVKLITIAIFLQLDYKYIAYGWLLEALGIFFIAGQLKNRILLLAGLAVLAMGTVGISLWVDVDYVAVSWLGEALGVFLMGLKLDSSELRHAGVAALAFGSTASVINAVDGQLFTSKSFLLNWPTLVMVTAVILAGIIYFQYKPGNENEGYVKMGVGIGTLLLFFAFMTVENHHFFLQHKFNFFLSPEQLSLSILWMVYAIALFVCGLKMEVSGLRYGALALIAVIVLKAFFIDLSNLATIFKILLFVILGLFLLGISFVYQKKRSLFDRSGTM